MWILQAGRQWKLLFIGLSLLLSATVVWGDSNSKHKQFTTDFDLAACTFSSMGENPYFTLNPAPGPMNPILLEGVEDKELVQVQISVNGTVNIDLSNLGLGIVEARVVEETEWVDGLMVEFSSNYFIRCVQTNDIIYLGEDVVIYEYDDEGNQTDVITGPEAGSWLAGELSEDGETFNMPGLIMPGRFLLGARYYQEVAPEVALDRAENIAMGLTVETPAGTFYNAVETLETTPLEANAKDIKIFAPEDGLIVDNVLERVNAFAEP